MGRRAQGKELGGEFTGHGDELNGRGGKDIGGRKQGGLWAPGPGGGWLVHQHGGEVGGECVSGLRHIEFQGLWDTKWKCPGARTQRSQDWRLRL